MDIAPMHLAGKVPLVDMAALETQVPGATPQLKAQLAEWGFMAVEIPGIGKLVQKLTDTFAAACASSQPKLSDYSHTSVPQLSSGGNHGFFPFYSEVPRLANGVPDPKEYLHVSGAMLENLPAGSAAVLEAFPALAAAARAAFDVSFRLVALIGLVVRSLLPEGTSDLRLDRHASILRIVHYRDVDGREVLAHEHSGIQMLGIQLPPSDQGLQYVLNDGTWVEPVLAGTDVVLANIGRMLTSASNDKFRPSTHRVHCSGGNPVGGYERWSAVLFAYPGHDEPQWTVTEDGLKISAATWGDFIRNRFQGLTGT